MHIQKSVSYLLESLQHALLQSHWSPTVAYSKAEVCSVWGKHGSAKLNRGTVLFVEHLKKPSLDQLYEKFYIRWDLKWFINVVYSEAKSSFLRVGFEPTTSELCAGALPTELSSPIVAVLGYFFNNYVGNRQHKARKQLVERQHVYPEVVGSSPTLVHFSLFNPYIFSKFTQSVSLVV